MIEAKTPQAAIGVEGDDPRINSKYGLRYCLSPLADLLVPYCCQVAQGRTSQGGSNALYLQPGCDRTSRLIDDLLR